MVRGDVGMGGQRHEGGGGADRVVRPVLGEGVQHGTGLEAVRQDERARAVQTGAELADHAGDVEQRRHREVDGRLGQSQAGPLPLGVVHDVAVRVGGALGCTTGARGVADQGDVGRTRVAVLGRLVTCAGDGRQVVGVGGRRQPLEGQHARVLAVLEVQLAAGQHDAYGRVGRRLAQIRLPGPVRADQRGHLTVPQDVPDLPRLVHRVDGHHGRARLPGAEQGEHEVRGVLQQDRHPVAALQATGGEVPGDGVAQLVGLAVGQTAVEVGEEGAVRGVGDGPAQGMHQRVGGVDRGALGVVEQAEPGLGRVTGVGHRLASHFCWRWFMLVSQRSGWAALAW